MKLVLVGGEEFADGFEDVHAALIQPVSGGQSRGVYLPTCAAHDGPFIVEMWCQRARDRLSPYAAVVDAPLVVDKVSASDPANVALVARADWIYLGGGFPNTGLEILDGTPVMAELQRAADRGALIIGASAGAMMMCARSVRITPRLFSGGAPELMDCLNWVPGSVCMPHFNKPYARRWLDERHHFPGLTLIGVDEQTALAHLNGDWQVLGHGGVTVVPPSGQSATYQADHKVRL